MNWRHIAIASLISLLAGGAGAQSKDDADRVQADVKTIIYALHDGDVDALIRLTPPKVIEMQGGAEKVRRMLQSVVAQTKSTGLRLESLTFPEPPEFLEGGGRRYAVVRTLQVVATGDQKVESLNFQLGILEPGAPHWVYVEGSRLNKENIQTLYPGFPADYEFPPFYRKKL